MRQYFDIPGEVWGSLSLEDVTAFANDLKLNGTYELPYQDEVYVRLHGANKIFGGEEIVPEYNKALGMRRVDQYLEVGPLGTRGNFTLNNWVFVFEFEKEATSGYALKGWQEANKQARRVGPRTIEVLYSNDTAANEAGADVDLDEYMSDGLIAVLAWKTLERRSVRPGVKARLSNRKAPLHIVTYITFGRQHYSQGEGGTRKPPRMHYRRAHMAHVAHGPGRSLRKDISRPAVWVNYDETKFGEMPLRTAYKIRMPRNEDVHKKLSEEATDQPSDARQDDRQTAGIPTAQDTSGTRH